MGVGWAGVWVSFRRICVVAYGGALGDRIDCGGYAGGDVGRRCPGIGVYRVRYGVDVFRGGAVSEVLFTDASVTTA